jgi:aryl-alcohol dehydrogenase-like predicted oxidoreductase
MAWQVMKGLGISDLNRSARFVSVQSYYSLAGRDVERELVPAVADQGLGLLCWSPLAGGLLSGKFDRSGTKDKESRRAKLQFPPVDADRAFAIVDVLRQLAPKHSATPAQIALAWLLSRSAVTSVIVGVKRLEQLEDNLGGTNVVLDKDDVQRLDDVSALAPSYPGWIQTYRANSRVPQAHLFTGPSWGPGDAPV